MAERAQKNLNKVSDFQLEVSEELEDIKGRINAVRAKI